jgi:capsular polysaccharide biosynthesis protein/tetratricopeptide (TPR) repeat protein
LGREARDIVKKLKYLNMYMTQFEFLRSFARRMKHFINRLRGVRGNLMSPAEAFAECSQALASQDYEKAIRLLKKYHRWYPKDAQFSYMAGYQLEQLGRYKEAAYFLKKAIRISTNSEYFMRIGLAYRGLGKFKKAFDYFSKSYADDPTNIALKKLVVDTALNFSGGLDALRSQKQIEGLDVYSVSSTSDVFAQTPESILDSFPNEKILIESVKVYGAKPNDFQTGTTQSGVAHLAKLENVDVIGGTDLIFDIKCSRLISDLTRYPDASKLDMTFNSLVYGFTPNIAIISLPRQDQIQLQRGIVLLSASSNAYGHWFFEHLPRLEILLRHPELQSVPLLIDDNLHTNHMEMLNRILKGKFEVIAVPAGRRVFLEEAFLLSHRAFMPTIMRPDYKPSFHMGPVSKKVLFFLRRELSAPPQKGILKIYFARRSSSWRKLINENEVISILREKNFLIVDAESLSFSQMTDLVSQAAVIIGPSGSAMNNVVFAPEGCRAIFLSPPNVGNYVTFLNALNDVGVRAAFYCGESQNRLSKHANFSIDSGLFKKSIDALI